MLQRKIPTQINLMKYIFGLLNGLTINGFRKKIDILGSFVMMVKLDVCIVKMLVN